MTPRKGLTAETVVDAATAVVEADGSEALTLSGVARELGVKPPSLYNHVESLEMLRRDVALRATRDLGARLASAAMGRSGRDALNAVADAFRSYVTDHPGLYTLTAEARPDDEQYAAAALQPVEPVLAILHSFDLDEDQGIHAARMLRSAIHGFVSLEAIGGFGLDVDVEASFWWMIDRLGDTLEAAASPG